MKYLLAFAATTRLCASAFAADRTDVHASAEDAQPLLPGMTAPAFEATAADGSTVTFTPGEAEKPSVLTYYLAPEVLIAAARSAAEGMDGRLEEAREAQRSQ